ncbi:geopeptide radical SAM maturase [Geobacter hydrogenophilus]|uniref:Radical SAM/SPASM domain-containing protein n=1 Tax=Geobacter hydrogenophilus TaxID=40983 RepID=A0A9W6FYN7_9BACT|nr:geopeptide radical SAM maturase [Geobacter hydrogenophilus]MBT0894587.1 geopeptide radical SAM maturase [Geobacter hydrogenophilus]GLI37218.1 radical SAM/SPASM domain-containing protein [Geobacter hydrogenophilus]
MILSRYVTSYLCPDFPDHLLLFSCRTGAVVRVSLVTLEAARSGTLSSSAAEVLGKHGFLTPDRVTEREEMLSWFDRTNAQRRRAGVVAVMTRRCNLACPYCFEGGQAPAGDMTEETADLLVAMIGREYFAKGWRVDLDFYGGEPLLRPDLIRRIAAPLKAAGGGLFHGHLVSNGTLMDRKVMTELVELGIESVKVTLDGPPRVHDRCRPYGGGTGSFRDILRGMSEVADLVTVHVGGNFTRETWREYPALLDILRAEGFTPDRLGTVRFTPAVGGKGGKALPHFVKGCVTCEEPWLAEAELTLRDELTRRGFRVPKPGPFSCMIELASDLAVDANGACYKCPAFMGHEGYAAGNLHDGLTGIAPAYGRDIWKQEECFDCTYLPLCFGGCRFMELVGKGAVDAVSCQREYLGATLEAMVCRANIPSPALRAPSPKGRGATIFPSP